ncbi:hypothetical protein KC19_6G189200 [Ceratodon purpureus]|uniref:Uncharacterized protein n=1 Tax=Ceratodon purpureus TaxID=3225 RepID=A0A8T0HJ47_CERPU|nr:hypothetical protein KC19_6G189200 [Ceratodon purpureus]
MWHCSLPKLAHNPPKLAHSPLKLSHSHPKLTHNYPKLTHSHSKVLCITQNATLMHAVRATACFGFSNLGHT